MRQRYRQERADRRKEASSQRLKAADSPDEARRQNRWDPQQAGCRPERPAGTKTVQQRVETLYNGSHTQDVYASRKDLRLSRTDKRRHSSKIEEDISANATEQESREGRGKKNQAVSVKTAEGHSVQTGAWTAACKNNGKAALVITHCPHTGKTGLNMISAVHLSTPGAGPQAQELVAANT